MISFLLALTLIPASSGFANPPVVASSNEGPTRLDKPDARLLDLEKELTQEQEKQRDHATPEQYKAYVARFRATLDEIMMRVAATAANQSVHERILVRLGDSNQALSDLNAALKQDPNNPRLATAKAYALFDQKDFVASAAAANAVLGVDPKNPDALWLKHASEDRNAPNIKLPISPWGAGPNEKDGAVAGGISIVSRDAANPYVLAIKVGATPAPPNYMPSPVPNTPPEKRSPLVPLAATGVLLWIGASLAARQAQDRVIDAAERGGESVVDRAASVAERGKELVEDHPYASGAVAIAGVLVGGILASPLIFGGGGPTLLAAGASGGAVPLAATAASIAPQAIAAAGAATIALAVGGDSPKTAETGKDREPSLPDAERSSPEAEESGTTEDPPKPSAEQADIFDKNVGHIFREAPGHVPYDTTENRQMLRVRPRI